MQPCHSALLSCFLSPNHVLLLAQRSVGQRPLRHAASIMVFPDQHAIPVSLYYITKEPCRNACLRVSEQVLAPSQSILDGEALRWSADVTINPRLLSHKLEMLSFSSSCSCALCGPKRQSVGQWAPQPQPALCNLPLSWRSKGAFHSFPCSHRLCCHAILSP